MDSIPMPVVHNRFGFNFIIMHHSFLKILGLWALMSSISVLGDRHCATLLIVGEYSAAVGMGELAREMGYRPLHLHPLPEDEVGREYTRAVAGYDSDHVFFTPHDISPSNLLSSIVSSTGQNLAGIIPGTQAAVSLTQGLTHAANDHQSELGLKNSLPENGRVEGQSEALINKGKAYELLEGVGYEVPPYLTSPDLDSLLKFASTRLSSFEKIVVKASAGAGGIAGETIDNTPAELARVFKKIKGYDDIDLLNSGVLIMPFYEGTEMAINFVRRGSHIDYTGVWEYSRKQRSGALSVQDMDWLCNLETHPHARKLLPIARHVTDTIGFVVGAFHLEVIITPDDRIIIIDPNARMSGGGLVQLEYLANHSNTHQLTINAHTKPILSGSPSETTYSLDVNAASVVLTSDGDAKFNTAPMDEILEIARNRGVALTTDFAYEHNARMAKSVDLDSVVGFVRLLGPETEVKNLANRIRALRDNKAFEQKI